MNRGKVLILCKTYPSPSGKYIETSCVAGISEDFKLLRLYPIPFRFLDGGQQFKKWQWVDIQYKKAKHDHRPESHSVNVETIKCIEPPLSTKNDWFERRQILKNIYVCKTFDEVEKKRQDEGFTLALLKPTQIVGLEIVEDKVSAWTSEELEKLSQQEKQKGLFDSPQKKSLIQLRKIPFKFYYRYTCDETGNKIFKHKIVDWEVGALFWRCYDEDQLTWEAKFREKLERSFPKKDLYFLMGTMQRWVNQWLIISLIYPPKIDTSQLDLFGS